MSIWQTIREKLPRKSLAGQFMRYLFTGGLAFVVDFGLFALCLYVFEWHYLVANLVGLLAGLVLNYALSVGWVFTACERKLEKKKTAEFAVFAAVGFIGVGLNELLMLLMVDVFEWLEMLSKMIAAGVVLMWNFGGRKLILFREKKD
ncbi:MAG: GtrA family protein [Fibrobacter sp.]|nr:GtrA family protein [Fibrobacter sp.]